jgi:diketogulonate reductase-like aldo/keto reductase
VQIILRWHIEHGLIPIPRSLDPVHIRENVDIFDFSLTPDEVAEIDQLEEGYRIIHPQKAPPDW